jgi:signal transduction histidine kinase
VLLDVMMPGMDGYRVASAIKESAATANIPVIMVTALDDRDARMRGLSVGAEDFLTKPVDSAELSARVKNLLLLKAAIEDAREARLMAEHANSAKTLFLRSMSHELRTPLNAISGFTELLELGIRGAVTPEQLEDLGRIKRASRYLLGLIDDLLTISRLEGARLVNLIPVAVDPMLVEVEGLSRNQAKARGVTLTVAPTDRGMFVAGDAERLQQILLNLVTNAIKFTSKGGNVDLTCDGDASTVRVRVTDTGIGIRPIDIDRVFEPFVQVDREQTTGSQQGVGLGLSISRELARAMHGDLTLRSTEGVGSTFTLTIPAAPVKLPPSAAFAADRAPRVIA